MLDVVASAMFIVVPVMLWSIWLVRNRRNYVLHKRVQLSLGGLLLVAVVLFEIDMRMNGWRHLAEPSPFYETWLFPVLYVHLFIAISTTLLWVITIVGALMKFPNPVRPTGYSVWHKRFAKPAAAGMCCTAVTGWTFYIMAFVA